MLLSHLGEYGCEWAYECNSPPIRNDHKMIARHSKVFVSIRGRSRGVTNITKAAKLMKTDPLAAVYFCLISCIAI